MIVLSFAGVLNDKSFFENNFADFSDVVRVKKIKILSSSWWRFQIATSPMALTWTYNFSVFNCFG